MPGEAPAYDSYGYVPGGYVEAAPDPDVAYRMQRYRSYDPASGNYRGYDGRRHPCPWRHLTAPRGRDVAQATFNSRCNSRAAAAAG